jgi:hypothetical protein
MADDADYVSAADFVTVAEAYRRLGISERQARRYAGHLPDNDRQTPDRGTVDCGRLSLDGRGIIKTMVISNTKKTTTYRC